MTSGAARALTASLDFEPSAAVLDKAVAELGALGADGGGAVVTADRREALNAYARAMRSRGGTFPRGWRHDYRALDFDDLQWTSGTLRAPAAPVSRPLLEAEPNVDAPALAVENAGGLVHFGAIAYESATKHGDARATVIPLSRARASHGAGVRSIYRRIVSPHVDRFVALSNAFQNCGAYVEVPPGVTLDAPLQLAWIGRPGKPAAVFPHVVVRIGPRARATIVERHVGSTASFVCGTVEVELGEDSRLDYVVVQTLDESARIAMRRAARSASGAQIAWHLAELGGNLIRSVVGAPVTKSGASVECNALYFAREYVHVDLALAVDHRAGPTRSDAIVRGVLTGYGRARIAASVRARRDAGRVDASLADEALVLSRSASVLATPATAIAEYDVGVRRRSSIGSLDEETLFYVRQRGIARSTATRMIALAFFEPAIARFPTEPLRDELRTALDQRLDEVAQTFE